MNDLTIRNKRVSTDELGNVCLNDLWALAGQPESRRAAEWHRGARAKALEGALLRRIVGDSHRSAKYQTASIAYYAVGRGKKRLTYAHPVLALDYAEYLDADIGIEVRELFLRYMSDAISLANDILDRVAEQVQEDELRVQVRLDNTARNKELARQGAKAGCQKYDYAELHNSGYRGLYDGLDADGIHKLKKLTKNQKILDHMTAAEGAANAFWSTQAALRLQKERPKTPEAAFKIVSDAGLHTRKAMEFGGTMPEDMPVPDGIAEAKKRLETNKMILGKK